ncbi:MAG: peptidoglycan-binding domain-containing protein, partial [Patescibacteria group bacterium]
SGANPTIASASLNGSSLSVAGVGVGSTSITACQQTGGCNTLSITTTAGGSSGAPSFSQMNPSITIGQILNINISGGSNIYSLSTNSNPNSLHAAVSGNTLTLSGKVVGSAIIGVCSSSGPCSSLTVNITEATTSNTTTNTTVSTNSIPASFALSLLTQIQNMESQLLQFSSQLAQLKISIQNLINSNFGSTNTTTNTPSVGAGMNLGTVNSYRFTVPLSLGNSGNEVTELQKRLLVEGVYSGEITGYFGPATEKSVKAYQAKRGLTPLGNVGPGTRAELNK